MDPDPDIFVIDLMMPTKNKTKKMFAYYFLKLHLHHFSKKKNPKDRRSRILEAQKHVDPVDPDPKHWPKFDSFSDLGCRSKKYSLSRRE
jgi:hypothetical protein